MYKTIVLAKIDYGCILYDSSPHSKILDPIHNATIKIALGAFHTFPTISLLAEANMMTLSFRCMKLTCKYACKLSASSNIPACKNIFINENYFPDISISTPVIFIQAAKYCRKIKYRFSKYHPKEFSCTPGSSIKNQRTNGNNRYWKRGIYTCLYSRNFI